MMDILKAYQEKRKAKRIARRKKLYERYKRIHALLKEHGNDILNSDNFKKTNGHIQHGSMTVHNHSMDVARYSLLFNKKLGLHCNQHDLIRGALLHDYFLYDWHEKDDSHKWHGFSHAKTALKNAEKDFELGEIEQDVIQKHMFPLNLQPPKYRESALVCIADKLSALEETIRRR